jgi:DNA-3-methyladenine glycosylase II
MGTRRKDDTGARLKKGGTTDAREAAALAFLKKADPELYKLALPFKGTVSSRVRPKRTNKELFSALASSIVSQQLSTKAAASIFSRLSESLGGAVTPEAIRAASSTQLRSCGLSGSKIRSLAELATEVHRGRLNLLALKKAAPEEAVQQLTKIYGIGPWTAEMFLIFALGAPDIFSPGDLILARRTERHLGLPPKQNVKALATHAERWSPHRSFVSLLMWRLHHEELGR